MQGNTEAAVFTSVLAINKNTYRSYNYNNFALYLSDARQ